MPNPADLDHRLRSVAGGEPDTEQALADVMMRIGRRTRRKALAVVAALAVAGGALAVWAVDARRSDNTSIFVGGPTTTLTAGGPCAPITGDEPAVGNYRVTAIPEGFSPDGPVKHTATGPVDLGGQDQPVLRLVGPKSRWIEVVAYRGYNPEAFVTAAHEGAPSRIITFQRCFDTPKGATLAKQRAELSVTTDRSVVGAQEWEYGGFIIIGGPDVTTSELLLIAGGLRDVYMPADSTSDAPGTTAPSCPMDPPFKAVVLPDGFSPELLHGSGGQITIGPDGVAVPIEPIDPAVHHYAGEPPRFIDIYSSTQPGYVPMKTETVDVLGTTGQLGEIEDGLEVAFALPCGTYALLAYGVSLADFKEVIAGLEFD